MSWASRRRTTYLLGIFLFLAVVVGIPLALSLHRAPSCTDSVQNQGETAVDKGGPCPVLDERLLAPVSILWSRSFEVREGNYSAVAYIENPNKDGGVVSIGYHFGLYDDRNVVVAERTGTTFIMPGGITPVFESAIDTGNRKVTHTYFEFTSPLVWKKVSNAAAALAISNKNISDTDSAPRLLANVENLSVASITGPSFVAVMYDPAGNAFAASATTLVRLNAAEKGQIVFTWNAPFSYAVGSIDILPLLQPAPVKQ